MGREVIDGAIFSDDPRFAVAAARSAQTLIVDHDQHGGGLASSADDKLIGFTKKLDAPLDIHQLGGTSPHQIDDSVSGSPTPNDPPGSISHENDDAIIEIDDDGSVFCGLAVGGEAGGVGDGEGHGGTTLGAGEEFRVLRNRVPGGGAMTSPTSVAACFQLASLSPEHVSSQTGSSCILASHTRHGGGVADPKPLWRMKSGTFLGWRKGDDFFGANGSRRGYFSGSKLFRDSDGLQVGDVSDEERVGWKNGYALNGSGARGTTTEKIYEEPREDITRNHNAAWLHPKI
jgi:hypothetical protein